MESGNGVPTIVVSRVVDETRVLGPSVRAVVWVRGCPLRCVGCIAHEDLAFEGGDAVAVHALAARLNALPERVTGVTFSGGEPMAQAGALVALVDVLRADRDWSVMSYSGYTLDRLLRRGDADQRALLARLDILVDGPYVQARHADLRWRGSDNQRLHYLTARHAPDADDRGAGLEMSVERGTLRWTGVPPVAGFRGAFESAMAGHGVRLRPEEED